MVKRNIVLLDIDYITHDEKPVMRLFGKVKGEKSNDLIAFGKRIGLSERYCREALGEISNVVNHWMDYAEKCGINEKRAKDINGMLLKF